MPPGLDYCAAPRLQHLRRLTTDQGIWQHAQGKTPNRERGYSIDDVARALIVVNRAARLFPELNAAAPDDPRTLKDLADVYLGFIERQQLPDGRFHNFVSVEGKPTDDVGSDDSFGRTIWALADTMRQGIVADHTARVQAVFAQARPHLKLREYVRTNAFLLLGLALLPDDLLDLELIRAAQEMIGSLLDAFDRNAKNNWRWFETVLTYSNGALPFSLFLASRMPRVPPETAARATAVARSALDFLLGETQSAGVPTPIGNRGWYALGEDKALYDQQPVDAAATTLACLAAFTVTRDERYQTLGESWLRWYEGSNVLGQPLLEDDGAVHDGINDGWINQNCGAESVVTYLLARLAWVEEMCRRQRADAADVIQP